MRSLAWDNVPDHDRINSFSWTITDISGRNLRLEEQNNWK